jgi:hypothetical protein
MRIGLGIVLLLALVAATPSQADDVTDQISAGLKAYQDHDTQKAIAALDTAANLLRQARADALKALLPAVPTGWTADDPEATTIGGAMLGGGTTASRVYHNDKQRVEVQFLGDSPMLQGMAALLGSPLATVGGMKTVVIGGRTMSYSDNDRSYMALVGDKIIVKVSGNGDTPDPTLKSFVAAIDFAGVEKLAH